MSAPAPVSARPPGSVPGAPRADGVPAAPWLARCDPSVLLAVVVALPVVLVRVVDPRPLAVLWLLAVVGALAAARMRPGRLAAAQLPFVWFGASLVAVNAVTRDGAVVARWGGLEVTDLGLEVGAGLALRTLLVGVAGAAVWHVTDPERLLASLHQVARLPVRAACALLAAHRLLDDLPREWTTIRQGQAARDPRRVRGGSVRPGSDPGSLARAAFALLATSVRRAERVSVALEARGLGALPRASRTVRLPASAGRADVVLVGAVGAAVAAVLTLA